MEECSVLIETTKSAEDKTSRWFDLPIDYELFRDLLGVEADSNDYQIIGMKLPFAGDIIRTTSVRRLNKLYFAYTDLSPEVQQAYKELIPYCGGVEDLLQKSEEFLFYPECHNIMDVARYRLEHNIEFSALSEKGKKYFNLEAYAHELEEKVLEITTDGSIHPKEALKEAAKILIYHFMLFSDEKITLESTDVDGNEEFDEEVLHMRQLLKTKLVDMDLSVRALNCLKAADVETLGDLVQFNKTDLLKFRNFGKKSLTELDDLLESLNLSFGTDISKYKLDKE